MYITTRRSALLLVLVACVAGTASGIVAVERAAGPLPADRRRRRLDQRRHRRHGRAGLGRDDAPDVPPLVVRPRLPDRARRGEPGRGGGPQVRDDDGEGRERVRRRTRPSAASTGSSASRRSTRPTGATPRSRRSSWHRCCRRTRTSRSTRATSASTPTARAAPAASTSTRPTRRCGSPTCRPASSSSARTSARRRRTRRRRCGSSSRGSPSSGGAARGGDRARAGSDAGHRLRKSNPLLRAASVPDGEGPPHGFRGGKRPGRARRRARRLRPRLPPGQGRREGVAEASYARALRPQLDCPRGSSRHPLLSSRTFSDFATSTRAPSGTCPRRRRLISGVYPLSVFPLRRTRQDSATIRNRPERPRRPVAVHLSSGAGTISSYHPPTALPSPRPDAYADGATAAGVAAPR